MSYVLVFLLSVLASINALLICPIPDYPLCGSDGVTYKNICEWQLAVLLNPGLHLLHIGPCQESAYELYKSLLKGNGNLLRSRHRKGKKHHKKRLSDSPPIYEGDDDDIITRLANMPFNFRREEERDEEEQEK